MLAPARARSSYYGKGNVVAFLLDAHIRRVTNGSKSFDDAIRLAYQRYGGPRGFTAAELRTTFEEVAGKNLKPWFAKAIGSAGELDYCEMLGWYGLRFAGGAGKTAVQLDSRSPAPRHHSHSARISPRSCRRRLEVAERFGRTQYHAYRSVARRRILCAPLHTEAT